MAISIRPYSAESIPAVREFNRRLERGGIASELRFPERPGELPGEAIVAIEEDGSVRGGYILNHQQFSFRGELRAIAHYRLPLSEGIVDRAHTAVGVQMLRHALKQQPLLYALGMGGIEKPLPKMLKLMGWNVRETPFYFRVNHAAAFLRNIQALRTTAARRFTLDLAAWSGAGSAAMKLLQPATPAAPVRAERFGEFARWAEDLWERCQPAYDMIAVRDSSALRAMYTGERFIRLRIALEGATIGWAVLLDTQMMDDKHFGNMRVGTIVDALAAPEDAPAVMSAAIQELERLGVDLIVSNQLHIAWSESLRAAGCRRGPSNFIFAASKKLNALAGEGAEIHINRGDGDGPIHL